MLDVFSGEVSSQVEWLLIIRFGVGRWTLAMRLCEAMAQAVRAGYPVDESFSMEYGEQLLDVVGAQHQQRADQILVILVWASIGTTNDWTTVFAALIQVLQELTAEKQKAGNSDTLLTDWIVKARYKDRK